MRAGASAARRRRRPGRRCARPRLHHVGPTGPSARLPGPAVAPARRAVPGRPLRRHVPGRPGVRALSGRRRRRAGPVSAGGRSVRRRRPGALGWQGGGRAAGVALARTRVSAWLGLGWSGVLRTACYAIECVWVGRAGGGLRSRLADPVG
jgi:hypothetical protein